MRRTIGFLLGATILFLSGCAASIHHPGSEIGAPTTHEASLNTWVSHELTPYLVQQLGKHPKFKGQPFLLVRMKGDDVQASIDDLTGQIRESVMDSLLTEPGINLAWRPAVRPWQHHQSLDALHCAEYRKIIYYIGIDTGLTKVDKKLFVKVRALNLKEGAWESGFGKSWIGDPTERQRAALNRTQTDEYLRGLRPLPFTVAEPDLLASYLAQNLSCLFKQRDSHEVVLCLDAKGSGRKVFFKTVFDLVASYLARFREVRVTRDPEHAHITIKTDVHPIHGDLYQVWVSALQKDGDRYIPGTETEAYVRLPKNVRASPKPVPGPIHMNPEPIGKQRIYRPLIASFGLLTPSGRAFCKTDTPWLSGERYLDDGEHLTTGGCVAITLSLTSAARIYLFGGNPQGDLNRLFPSQCRELAHLNNRVPPDQGFRFPPLSGTGARALILEDAPGTERVYAVAISDAQMARRFEKYIRGIPGLCGTGGTGMANDLQKETGNGNPFAGWQRDLEAMVKESSGAFEWQMRWFEHKS